MSGTIERDRILRGAIAGFCVIPLLTAHHHSAVAQTDTVGKSWRIVNNYISKGATTVYDREYKGRKSKLAS
jgi:hypothetical protein